MTAANAPFPFARILVAVDATPASTAALRYLRRLLRPGATVRVVAVAENPRTLVPLGGWAGAQLEAARDELRLDAEAAIKSAQTELDGCGANVEGQLIDLCRVGGDLVHALAEAISQSSPDLVVLGARHHGALLRWVEGEVSAPLARLLHAPILIIPVEYEGGLDGPPSRILFATDGSDASLNALRAGARLVAPRSDWRVVYVVDRLLARGTGPFEEQLEDSLVKSGEVALKMAGDELAADGQQSQRVVETAIIRTRSAYDDVPHAIDRDARHWKPQLVLLGTHGRRGLTRWLLGSVAERTLRLTSVPLLLVPPADNQVSLGTDAPTHHG
ncbi:Nucleotide-binding universal stress protein, UspA family [Paraburkholderia lycopersici]|uniref:Nucleotide-binding universal stress protein, UspA family n=2 Tax=Paraburkholderia lycopersici TaxID=416944 RepID=A0A1G7CY82_9BURK|nr:universal stress protein [Paraburkholderia lycopersici]SDE44268.1 Nucleotide-binding universal stress protein, UspA family [Paraburkholderia lycopersici]